MRPPPVPRARCVRRRALSWPALLLSWALAWLVLLPFAQAASAATTGETLQDAVQGALAGLTIPADDREDAQTGWQLPAPAELTAIEPLPDRESDPTVGPMPARRHATAFRRHQAVIDGEIRFRPDSCLPPHGHAPPHA